MTKYVILLYRWLEMRILAASTKFRETFETKVEQTHKWHISHCNYKLILFTLRIVYFTVWSEERENCHLPFWSLNILFHVWWGFNSKNFSRFWLLLVGKSTSWTKLFSDHFDTLLFLGLSNMLRYILLEIWKMPRIYITFLQNYGIS